MNDLVFFRSMMMLLEGGNVFKAQDYTKENPKMLTDRIGKDEVPYTVQYLEKLTGLPLKNNLLGSTGIADSSGDMDIGVDITVYTNTGELLQHLLQLGIDPKHLKKGSDQVHYMSPIYGPHGKTNRYVQVDFMLGDTDWLKMMMRGGLQNSPYKGVHRHQLLASIAKARNPNYKWSHKLGLATRDSNEVVANNEDKIAKLLLNKTAKAQDLHSVEAILKAIANDPKYEQLTQEFKDTLAKSPKGPQLQESLSSPILSESSVGREFQHLEDLVYVNGIQGAYTAIQRLRELASDSSHLEVKWDGSPAIIFGRDAQGKFHFGDKYHKELNNSAKQVYQSYLGRGTASESKIALADKMSKLWKLYESATPKTFKGYVEAGLLWDQPLQPVKGAYRFMPNTVEYAVAATSDLGKRIAQSMTGCAATAVFNELPALGGTRSPVGNTWRELGNARVIVMPPLFAATQAKIDIRQLDKLESDLKKVEKIIAAFIEPEPGLSDIRNIIYAYVNSQVDDLSQLGKNFATYLQARSNEGKLSQGKYNKIITRLQNNKQGAAALFSLIRKLMAIKDDIIDQLEPLTLAQMGMTAKLHTGEQGGEGFVSDPDGGVDPIKFVKRGGFTAANRAKNR